jgi:sulfur carrier protein ThiS
MAFQLRFTRHLVRFFPELPVEAVDVDATTVADAIADLEQRFPRLGHYLADERGRLRKHVVLFIDGEHCGDADALQRAVPDGAEVFVAQALSGG